MPKTKLTEEQLDVRAQYWGFPSHQALQTIIQLGAHIQGGGKITKGWVDKVAEVYPAVPRDVLAQYAERIHSVNDLAHAVGVDPGAAHKHVSDYAVNDIAATLNARMDNRAPHEVRGVPPSPTAQAAAEDYKDRYMNVANQILPPGSAIRAALPSRERAQLLADKLDRVVERQLETNARYEQEHADPAYSRWADRRSMHDDVTNAYDSVTTMDEADQMLDKEEKLDG